MAKIAASWILERVANEMVWFREYYDNDDSWRQTLDKSVVGQLDADDGLAAQAKELMIGGTEG